MTWGRSPLPATVTFHTGHPEQLADQFWPDIEQFRSNYYQQAYGDELGSRIAHATTKGRWCDPNLSTLANCYRTDPQAVVVEHSTEGIVGVAQSFDEVYSRRVGSLAFIEERIKAHVPNFVGERQARLEEVITSQEVLADAMVHLALLPRRGDQITTVRPWAELPNLTNWVESWGYKKKAHFEAQQAHLARVTVKQALFATDVLAVKNELHYKRGPIFGKRIVDQTASAS